MIKQQPWGIKNFLTMNAGDDQNSYAKNSSPQRSGIMKARPIVDEALQDLCKNHFPAECLRIADLGCSSGPNTLLFISNAIDTVARFSQLHQLRLPQFQVFLNDLPHNDFNNLFKLLPTFYEKLQQQQQISNMIMPIQCYVSASPGSFYGRLFPDKTMNFIHSSHSLQWLSQVPNGLGNNNKGDIYISRKTPLNVIEAYSKQYRKDLSTFLSLRAEEIIPGGRMVVLIVCRDEADHSVKDVFQFKMVSTSLLDLAAQGLVKEEDIDSFNIPLYLPHEEEVKGVIESEGSFELNKLEVFEVNWVKLRSKDEYEEEGQGNNKVFNREEEEGARIVAGAVRAYMEPLVVSHFGNSIIEPLFERCVKNMSEHPCDRISNFVGVVSLTRKLLQ